MRKREQFSTLERIRHLLVGGARDLKDEHIFQKVTLIAVLGWVGLGSDGLSSSSYGPEEAYKVLGNFHGMTIFIAFAVVLTIFIISTSYIQIIKLFPAGGGGYKVATKLLSPRLGMVSGCSLIVDYVLTIAISIASGVDAIFSNFPTSMQPYKIWVTLLVILILLLINLRGIRESVVSLMPIFIVFILAHAVALIYPVLFHYREYVNLVPNATQEFKQAGSSLGTFAVLLILARAYSMGAGTYTGIEAVSNSMQILKEPRQRTGIRVMRLMAFSLAIMVLGLMAAYSLYKLHHIPGQTMNATLLTTMSAGWNPFIGKSFVIITLFSEAALLFVAAQTGFFDGPRVISNMAQDRWFPGRFSVLSDRLVTQNGLFLMAIAAAFVILVTRQSVNVLIVLYSINVFITFSMSQTGMVRHWWLEKNKEKHWISKLLINGLGLILTVSILITVLFIKFREGGWLTIVITSSLIFFVVRVRNHYERAEKLLHRLDHRMAKNTDPVIFEFRDSGNKPPEFVQGSHTACICVNEYNGIGINTFLKVREDFENYRNFVFISVGMVDSGNFKGIEELNNLEDHVRDTLQKYQELANAYGCYADFYYSLGTDVADEVKELSKKVIDKYKRVIFFVGQAIFSRPSSLTRMLHNQTQLTLQNRLAHKGFMMVMIPVKLTVN